MTTRYVPGDHGPSDYGTIQEAFRAAANGDTIFVDSGYTGEKGAYTNWLTELTLYASAPVTGIEVIFQAPGTSLTIRGTANVRAMGSRGDDTLRGDEGNDTLMGGGGNDTLMGGRGADWLDGTFGAATASYLESTGMQGVTVDLVAGTAIDNWGFRDRLDYVYSAIGSYRGDRMVGGWLSGENGDDTLSGLNGNNSLFGGAGDDVLAGAEGNDTLDGGYYGTDTADYRESVSYDHRPPVQGVTVDLAAGKATDNWGGHDVLSYIENVIGSNLADTLAGNGEANLLSGNGGSDTLAGGDGDDRLDGGNGSDWLRGGAGGDTLAGGSGMDVVVYDDAIVGVTVNLVTGKATDGLGGTDRLVGVESAIGSRHGDTLLLGAVGGSALGRAGDDRITGGAGNDRLQGGSGADRLQGGLGVDTVSYLDDGHDSGGVSHNGATVKLQPGWAIDSWGNTDTLAGFENIEGSAFSDVLMGNGLGNLIQGLTGNDMLDGMGGVDTMIGGAGEDIYVVDNAGDRAIEAKNQGADQVLASASYVLGDNIENLTLTGSAAIDGTGNAMVNVIVGNGAANRLDGKAGADRMSGGAGNDTYFVDNAGDMAMENLDAGRDLVISTVSFTLDTGLENLTLSGPNALRGTGNAQANVLVGSAAANRLDGLAGKDTLTGGAGADVFVFSTIGAGNVDTITDFVSGTDRIALANAAFPALPRGTLSAAAFVQATAAATSRQHILYNAATGVLSYDADGSGAGAAIAFARVQPGTEVAAGDFRIA